SSPNVINGLIAAREQGAFTIGFTGEHGETIAGIVDIALRVPSANTQRIQEAHITAWHAICGAVECELFGNAFSGAEADTGTYLSNPSGVDGAPSTSVR